MTARIHRLPTPVGSPDDIAREARIQQLAADLKRHAKAGPMAVSKCIEIHAEMVREIAARSPEQVARMERERGLCP